MKTRDLSRGSPLKLLIIFSLPMVLSVAFQQLYNIADSVIAGRMLGRDALAAVSVSYPVTMIYMCVGTGMAVGCGILTSRAYGLKKTDALKTTVSTSFTVILLIGTAMTVIGFFAAKPLLRLLSTPPEIFDDAAEYLQIYTLGMVFVYLYSACNVVFQALGNSKIPLCFLIFSTLLNVVLDICFLLIPGAGVASLSTATVIAQGTACTGSVLVLCSLLGSVGRGNDIKPGFVKKAAAVFMSLAAFAARKKSYKIFSKPVLFEMLSLGIPSVLSAASVSVGQLFVQNLINGYGTTVVAGYGAGIKIFTFFVQITIAEADALGMFMSQNVGAGTHSRLKKGMAAGLLIMAVTTAAAAGAGLSLAPQIMSLFISGENSAGVIAIGTRMLYIILPFQFIVINKFVCDALLKSAGFMIGFVTGTFIDLVTRVGFAYLLSWLLQSSSGIWWSWPIGWIIGTLIAVAFVLFAPWKKKIAPYNGENAEQAAAAL